MSAALAPAVTARPVQAADPPVLGSHGTSSEDASSDLDQPYERIRALGPQERDPGLASAIAPGRPCVIHRLKAQLEQDARSLDAGALHWIQSYERAIARGDVKPCRCSPSAEAK